MKIRRVYLIVLVGFLSVLSASAQAAPRVVADQDYLPKLLEILNTAQRQVDVMAFSFAIDRGGLPDPRMAPFRVAEKLVELKRRKGDSIRIRLYIEASRDTAARNEITARYLEGNGIEVRRGATHAKGIRIDSRFVLFGSTNLTDQSLIKNNETNLLLDDPLSIREFARFFDHLWSGGAHGEINLQKPLIADGVYKELLIQLINDAKSNLDFAIYYFNDREIEQALIDAHRRGVKIRGYVNQHTSHALPLVERNRLTVNRLKTAGINEVYLDLDATFSHSKYLIVDSSQLLLGTGNWNTSDVNEHRQLYALIRDPHLATALSSHLTQQIAYESERAVAGTLYHRFWVGWKRPEIETRDFDSIIDRVFVDATVAAIGAKGGQSYQPVLTVYDPAVLTDRARRGARIPDEIALVSYSDSLIYQATRSAEIGREYGPLHRDYFHMEAGHVENSGSVEPEPYAGKVELGHAYDLSSREVDWQKEGGHFLIQLRRDSVEITDDRYAEAMSEYLNAIQVAKNRVSIDGYVAIVGPEYLIEYFHAKNPRARTAVLDFLNRLKVNSKALEITSLQSEIIRVERAGRSVLRREQGRAGVSVAFDRELKMDAIMSGSSATLMRNAGEQTRIQRRIRASLLRGRSH